MDLNKASLWFSADSHYFHKKLVQPRGFSSVEEMNETIINRLNEKVGRKDALFFLGDFSMGAPRDIPLLRKRINCQHIYLVYGNHDEEIRRHKELQTLFVKIYDLHRLRLKRFEYGKLDIILSHYSLRVWEKSHYGSLHIFGHSHGSLRGELGRSMDVGVDTNNFYPYSLDDIYQKLSNKSFIPVDHHIPITEKPFYE